MPTILIVMCSWLIFWLKLDTADQVIYTIWIVSKSLKRNKSENQPHNFLSGITGSIVNVDHGDNKWGNTRSFTPSVLCKGTDLVHHSLRKHCHRHFICVTRSSFCFQAIDIWMFSGLFFVIGSLLKGALMNFIHKCNSEEQKEWLLKKERCLNRICRIVFPAAYILFNITYWSYYTNK